MDKGKIEAMVTKFSEKFAIIMLKKYRKFCRCGLTHFDATPIFKKSFRYIWATLYKASALPLHHRGLLSTYLNQVYLFSLCYTFVRANNEKFYPLISTSDLFCIWLKDPNFHRTMVQRWEPRSYWLNRKFINFKIESKMYLFEHIIM